MKVIFKLDNDLEKQFKKLTPDRQQILIEQLQAEIGRLIEQQQLDMAEEERVAAVTIEMIDDD